MFEGLGGGVAGIGGRGRGERDFQLYMIHFVEPGCGICF